MYRINRTDNDIEVLEEKSFHSLNFKERDHLQEWIAKNPQVLGNGDDLLIIQKEFAGFNDTNERLDLLALDKERRLVIIENKLDDSGKDVVWQALKYTSYCSTLSTSQIIKIYQEYLDKYFDEKDAKSNILEFLSLDEESELLLNRQDQRIIFVANNFRKEVTSTVLWLLNHDVQIQCFKAKPYSMGEEVILQIEQIIPLPETQEFMIDAKEKQKEEVREVQKNTRDYTRYVFKGNTFNKRKLALAIIQQWIKENNPQNIENLKQAFPDNLRRGGIFLPEQEAIEIAKRQGIDRHFLKQDEVIEFSDSARYAINNQWGKDNINAFIGHAKNSFNYEIVVADE